MFRLITAILLILVGLVGIAAGIWGIYTVKTNSDLDMALAYIGLVDLAPKTEGDNLLVNGANAVLGAANNAMSAVDSFWSETFGDSATSMINNLLGDGIDLTNTHDMQLNICKYRVEILLVGIILLQSGLLMFKFGKG